ncbi:Ethyl tert-butyl ether degradation EthD [Mesorhizobium prunaredense]|uniref:Ethyl tert-butyl ether degradation EthD n=1 Tax=Mesorhizobium prunaredense TaxID=1631249 RepID=A0A1R3V9Z1_9HYPH|nr:EthD domain-containing protein [Mesorhizobium prunaredense]SIT55607.1 Ethyl tert-butyl ether degradation EthD [Mesorhizobium prunaredense]
MIKLSLFLTRRPDLSFEEFSDYWMNIHWPLVKTVPEITENAIRYVQQHNIGAVPGPVTPAPFDGVAEAWFPDMAAVGRVMGSDGWANVVMKDDPNFLDVSKTLVMFSEEKVDFKA